MTRNLVVAASVVLWLAGSSSGANLAPKCAALKIKESGKKAAAKLKCYAKAVAASRPVSNDCLKRAEDRFRAKFAKADAGGGCIVSGDAQVIEGKVDSFVDDVVSELPAAATSTTLIATTTTSSSTSTTVPTGPCQCGTPVPTRLQFTTVTGSGNCGVATRNNGTLYTNLACGGLYSGGGLNTVPLPIVEPDMGTSVLGVTACNATLLTLGATTAADTLSTSTCTAAGCRFGAPVPVPNPNAPAASYCLVRSVAADATGIGDCATGTVQLSLPLHWDAFITGDMLTDAGHPGIQPCPLCEGGMCRGGPNDGLPCTPETSALTSGYPTSHDCPPPPNLDASDQVVDYAPTTATVTQTAHASSFQQRVFCGFCRDDDVTGDFENPPHPCQSDAECAQPFEACQQRTNGAFGPAGGAVMTITENGAPGGDLRDNAGHAATLASIFCIPPSYNATLDAENDWPGPGAVTNPVTLQLVP